VEVQFSLAMHYWLKMDDTSSQYQQKGALASPDSTVGHKNPSSVRQLFQLTMRDCDEQKYFSLLL